MLRDGNTLESNISVQLLNWDEGEMVRSALKLMENAQIQMRPFGRFLNTVVQGKTSAWCLLLCHWVMPLTPATAKKSSGDHHDHRESNELIYQFWPNIIIDTFMTLFVVIFSRFSRTFCTWDCIKSDFNGDKIWKLFYAQKGTFKAR